MPVTYYIDQGILYTRCAGNATFREVLDHFRVLEEDPALPNSLDVLLDLTQLDSLPESSQLRSVSSEIGRISDKVRFEALAVVASSDVLYGLCRMFEVYAQPHFRTIQVFRQLQEAAEWIAVQHAMGTDSGPASSSRAGSAG